MNHLEFAAAESAALEKTMWEEWIEAAEALVGHHLDGDQDEDGYSYDHAYDAWKAGRSVPEYFETIRAGVSRRHLTELAAWLNRGYKLDLANIATSGPRQGLADETPYLQVARQHTPADVLVAVSLDVSYGHPQYRIEVFTSTAWGDLGDPFMRFEELRLTDAANRITNYVPYIPTV